MNHESLCIELVAIQIECKAQLTTVNSSLLIIQAGATDGECSVLVEVTSVQEPVRQSDTRLTHRFSSECRYGNDNNKRRHNTSAPTVINHNCRPACLLPTETGPFIMSRHNSGHCSCHSSYILHLAFFDRVTAQQLPGINNQDATT